MSTITINCTDDFLESACVPICAHAGFGAMATALYSILGVIATSVSTIAVAYFRFHNASLEEKARQADEMLALQQKKVKAAEDQVSATKEHTEVLKSLSPKASQSFGSTGSG